MGDWKYCKEQLKRLMGLKIKEDKKIIGKFFEIKS